MMLSAPIVKLLRMISVLLLSILSGCLFEKVDQFQLLGSTLDTSYSVIVVAPPKGVGEDMLREQLKDELAYVSSLISSYDPESELSKFNASELTEWTPLSKDTIKLIQACRRISKASGGAYDITLAGVSKLWNSVSGDQSTGLEQARPSLDQILELMNEVGYQLLLVSGSEINVRKLTPNLQVDLSSIGKGFAVDRVSQILEANGVGRYMVDIGGAIRTRGLTADGNMWKIGIELPPGSQHAGPSGVEVEDAHVVTVGNFRDYREVDGQRVTQFLDGRTGFPIQHNLASVTLLHGSVAMADAWATAFFAMGYDEATKMAEDKGIAAQFTIKEGEGFEVHSTASFDAYAYVDK